MKLLNAITLAMFVGLALQGSILAQAETTNINGAGATFPYPIYSKWFSEFQKVKPAYAINYQSVGSGAGIRQLMDQTVDFGASDAPMTDEQLSKSTKPVVHIPTVLGAVVLSYSLEKVKAPIQLTGELVADIFLGKITKWNDPKLVALNAELKAMDLPITVVHRSDGSGTTAVFADYMAKVSSEWKEKIGTGNALKWPTGLGGKGNEGVTGLIKQTPGAVGYIELIYAESNQLPTARMKNKAGKFIQASTQSVTEAAKASLKDIPADFRASITDAAGKESYPISSFTYLLVYQTLPKKQGEGLLAFMNWAVTDGQAMAEGLKYSKLPKALADKVKAKIKTIKIMN